MRTAPPQHEVDYATMVRRGVYAFRAGGVPFMPESDAG